MTTLPAHLFFFRSAIRSFFFSACSCFTSARCCFMAARMPSISALSSGVSWTWVPVVLYSSLQPPSRQRLPIPSTQDDIVTMRIRLGCNEHLLLHGKPLARLRTVQSQGSAFNESTRRTGMPPPRTSMCLQGNSSPAEKRVVCISLRSHRKDTRSLIVDIAWFHRPRQAILVCLEPNRKLRPFVSPTVP